jgi:hypothetical protein
MILLARGAGFGEELKYYVDSYACNIPQQFKL